MPTIVMHPFSPQDIANSGLSGAGGVDQGKYTDCVFEASAAAVATTKSGQAAISQMIVQNSDGSYTVTFPGEFQNPVTVTQSDLTATGVSDSATWADVLEAALVKSDPGFASGALPPNASGAVGGSPPTEAQYALYLLTGNLASYERADLASSAKIGSDIDKALRNDQPVVANCYNDDQQALVAGHEWTVMACDPQGNQITLRNPWGSFGSAGTTKNGVTYDGNAEVTMSLNIFGQYYNEVTFGDVLLLNGWLAQGQIPNAASSSGPSLAAFGNKLYIAWKGESSDQRLFYASFDGSNWLVQGQIPNVASSSGPSLAAFGNKLYIAWKGESSDQRLFYASFDGSNWSAGQIPGVASSTGPALSEFNGTLCAAWKGEGNDQNLYYSRHA
jgi:hypothetical protein